MSESEGRLSRAAENMWRERAKTAEAEVVRLRAALREPPQKHQPPAVHHLCGPNVIGVTGPPHASWCYHDRTWVDGAAQQDDYTCSACGSKISTNVSEWALREPPTNADQVGTFADLRGVCRGPESDADFQAAVAGVREPPPQEEACDLGKLVSAALSIRYQSSFCGACGVTYSHCRSCDVGVRVQSDTSGGQCGGHRNTPCAESCLAQRAIAAASSRLREPQEQASIREPETWDEDSRANQIRFAVDQLAKIARGGKPFNGDAEAAIRANVARALAALPAEISIEQRAALYLEKSRLREPQEERVQHDGECVFWDDQSLGACDCGLTARLREPEAPQERPEHRPWYCAGCKRIGNSDPNRCPAIAALRAPQESTHVRDEYLGLTPRDTDHD